MKNSVDLKLDMRTYGDPSNPCVISIVGTGASMNSMNPIVEGLAERGLFVINFNPRDVCGTEAFRQCEALVPADMNLMEVMGTLFGADGSFNRNGLLCALQLVRYGGRCCAGHGRSEGVKGIIGFSTGGGIAQVAMCRLQERLSSAVICSSVYDLTPSENPLENPALKENMAKVATLTPESSKEERVEMHLPFFKTLFEVSEGDPREDILRKAIVDDCEKGWVDVFGGMNPFSTLAWAGFAKTHEEHKARLRENKVPCLVVAGKSDPLIPFRDVEKLAANTGSAAFLAHENGHILGPATSNAEMLNAIADFIRSNSAMIA